MSRWVKNTDCYYISTLYYVLVPNHLGHHTQSSSFYRLLCPSRLPAILIEVINTIALIVGRCKNWRKSPFTISSWVASFWPLLAMVKYKCFTGSSMYDVTNISVDKGCVKENFPLFLFLWNQNLLWASSHTADTPMINFDFHQFAKGGKIEKLENLLGPQLKVHWEELGIFTKGNNASPRWVSANLTTGVCFSFLRID